MQTEKDMKIRIVRYHDYVENSIWVGFSEIQKGQEGGAETHGAGIVPKVINSICL